MTLTFFTDEERKAIDEEIARRKREREVEPRPSLDLNNDWLTPWLILIGVLVVIWFLIRGKSRSVSVSRGTRSSNLISERERRDIYTSAREFLNPRGRSSGPMTRSQTRGRI